ncbi:microsomal glutathione S-transferase 1-like [Corticium candelabrum]|uniref:microsomal glutathione S-transferase 1-like n=1 Tax=Corticium candelabrum TaxID=121492 RepID=UPI002E265CEA|nr:microsomal glutathione S-transferase 1-like [Corticium candelabrum]
MMADGLLLETLLEDPVFSAFVFYSVMILTKMVLVQSWTTVIRFQYRVPALPEDYQKPSKDPDAKPKTGYSDLEGRYQENVQRVRRLHLNDMENIPVFVILSFFYVLTRPSLTVAVWHFRFYLVGRVLHSIVYLLALQPHRTIFYILAHIPFVSILLQLIYFVLNL